MVISKMGQRAIRKSLVFFAHFLISFAAGNRGGKDCTTGTCHLNDNSIRFFIIGDWGGKQEEPYVTEAQQVCATLMQEKGDSERAHFVVSTGDNFYEYGVDSVDDPRFNISFENVFLWGKQNNTPWYLTMGNHDWYGNASAQIAYTWKNDRWVAPDFFFTVSYATQPRGPSVDFVFIDTVLLCGNTWDDQAGFDPNTGRMGKKTDYYLGPANPTFAADKWRWIETQLAKSQCCFWSENPSQNRQIAVYGEKWSRMLVDRLEADFLFVVGHYPSFASDWHNISWCFVPKLQDLMEKYNASGYIAGHAHNLQHSKTISRLSGRPIHHVISGAGHSAKAGFEPVFSTLQSNPWQVSNEFFFPGETSKKKKDFGTGGLVYVYLGPTIAKFDYYNCTGEKVYSFQAEARWL